MDQKIINKSVRLVADIPQSIHQEIKSRSAWYNISMRKYILQAIMERIKRDKETE